MAKPAPQIPNPLESGQFTLDGGSFTGNVGSTDPDNQPVLSLEHGATVDADTAGFGSPFVVAGQARFSTFDVKQTDTLNITALGGSPLPGPGIETVNVEPGGRADLNIQQGLGQLTVNGGNGARVVNFDGTIFNGGKVSIQPALVGSGTVSLVASDPPPNSLTLDRGVSSRETIRLNEGNLQLNDPMQFLGEIDWQPGSDIPLPITTTLAGVSADSYSLSNDMLSLFQGDRDVLNLRVSVPAGAPFNVSGTSQGVLLSTFSPQPGNGTPLPVHASVIG